MDFKKQKPIYLQIADTLCERIVAGEWQVDERVPSVRDVAAELGVNPNTVMRTYDYNLQPPRSGLLCRTQGGRTHP